MWWNCLKITAGVLPPRFGRNALRSFRLMYHFYLMLTDRVWLVRVLAGSGAASLFVLHCSRCSWYPRCITLVYPFSHKSFWLIWAFHYFKLKLSLLSIFRLGYLWFFNFGEVTTETIIRSIDNLFTIHLFLFICIRKQGPNNKHKTDLQSANYSYNKQINLLSLNFVGPS